ncbi:beta/alpha barrel domain-containing protein [Adhaeribacter rhizoryzae]|uniref:Hydroxymethylglutaryl-CoA lyase n=1 Tax=Adhaeribacter rhizoryzae TaxID=2607907 RepID=A0A5M6DE79_9BACT|nr:hydroxymethylglutaryl-CoA lyase [Adhaeribacter rhizoryzae]KAA5543495.1 hydroxymethylglutaryl-CoA lyase [Adhaeribacter rhizoryzae]
MIKLIECPRDAMQGWPNYIPASVKAAYLNILLQVGFDTLDFGSFVSPKAIPQMQDTEAVLAELDLENSKTKLLAIVANLRGAEKAASLPEITYLGFPLSLSETFQLRNTNRTITQAFELLAQMQELCSRQNKILVVYLSMGFGNPYAEPWNANIVLEFVHRLVPLGIKIISLADTVGLATPANIYYLFSELIPTFPDIAFGVHLHARPDNWEEKISAAYNAGCFRFDGALKGFGGCPMAKDDLVGNVATENLIRYFQNINLPLKLNEKALNAALAQAAAVFV